MDAGFFVVREFARSDAEHLLDEGIEGLVHALVFDQDTGVEVNPSRFALSQTAVGADLHGRNEGAEWRATTGGEEYQLTTGSRQSGGGDEVVARSREEVETVVLDAFAILHDAADDTLARLLGAAESFLFEGRDTARLVAWAWILATRFTVREEVVLEVVDERDGLVEQLLVAATLHEDGLGTEHFRNFGEDGGATLGLAEEVGESTNQWVARDARIAVGAATLQADAECRGRTGLTLEGLCVLDDLGEGLDTVLHFVALNLLANHELNAVRIIAFAELLEDLRLVVLATQADDEDATCIGVKNHVAKHFLGVFVVLAELGATIVVREVEDAIDRTQVAGKGGTGLLDNLLDDAVDATDGWDDPHLVADTDLTVSTFEALEGILFAAWLLLLQTLELDAAVVERALQVGLDVLVVEETAALDGVTGMANRETVLDDVLALGKVLEGTFMSCRYVGDESHLVALDVERRALGQRNQGNEDIVGRIDLDKLLHKIFKGY